MIAEKMYDIEYDVAVAGYRVTVSPSDEAVGPYDLPSAGGLANRVDDGARPSWVNYTKEQRDYVLLSASILEDAAGIGSGILPTEVTYFALKLSATLDHSTTAAFSLRPGYPLYDFVAEIEKRSGGAPGEDEVPDTGPSLSVPIAELSYEQLLRVVEGGAIGAQEYSDRDRVLCGEELVRRGRENAAELLGDDTPEAAETGTPDSESVEIDEGAIGAIGGSSEGCLSYLFEHYQHAEAGEDPSKDGTYLARLWVSGYGALPPNVEIYRAPSQLFALRGMVSCAAIAFDAADAIGGEEDGS